jgi:uncharacterized membrane protein (DUF485 family)
VPAFARSPHGDPARRFIQMGLGQMRRLSSRMTFFYKRVFPVIWFGFLATFMAGALGAPLIGGSTSGSPAAFLLIPVIMMIAGYFMMKKLVFDLVDEVLDGGDVLVVRNGGREEQVALADIMNVGYAPLMNPPRVTLSLRSPTQFGDRISFCAPVRFLPFATSPVIDELIKRTDAARRAAPRRRAG